MYQNDKVEDFILSKYENLFRSAFLCSIFLALSNIRPPQHENLLQNLKQKKRVQHY